MPDMHNLHGFSRFTKQNSPIVKLSVTNHNLDALVSKVLSDISVFCLLFMVLERR
jgi:hypothetical protein